MRYCVYFLLFILTINCSSTKRSYNNLYAGNYDKSIQLSINKLKKTRNVKKRKELSLLLQKAYNKAVIENNNRINLLQKENTLKNAEEIYNTYLNLSKRQRLISPLLPLNNLEFTINDYNNQIVSAKKEYAKHLYQEGKRHVTSNNTSLMEYRTAHHYLTTLQSLYPNYAEDLKNLLNEALFKGTDFVHVTIQNNTEQVIPKRLEDAILDFQTYQLDDFWTEYHADMQKNINYNFGITLNIKQILVSPEQINEKEMVREREISNGFTYVLDGNGNVAKDSLGNDIKEEAYKIIKARVTQINQFKSAMVTGQVLYKNLPQNKTLSNFPLQSEFIFENIYANFRGDKKALNKNDRRLLQNDFIPFPTNEQMIFDTSTDLKRRFAQILRRNKFRR